MWISVIFKDKKKYQKIKKKFCLKTAYEILITLLLRGNCLRVSTHTFLPDGALRTATADGEIS